LNVFVEREYTRWSNAESKQIRQFFKDHIYGSGMPRMFNMLPCFLLCDAMHKHGLCHRLVSVFPSVTFIYSVKTNKYIFKFFSPLGSHTIIVFEPNVVTVVRWWPP